MILFGGTIKIVDFENENLKGNKEKMSRTCFRIEKEHADFPGQLKTCGFKDEREMQETAIERFSQDLERDDLKQSADRYAEVYSENDELKELAESAIADWPD